jgi:lipopolysaccharide transport system permease protein
MGLNPLQLPIELTRAALLDGTMPEWGAYAANLLGAALVFHVGYLFFQKLRPGFADVV